MRLVYWSLAAIVLAAAIHIGLVLYTPRQEMSERIARAASAEGMNSFRVAGTEARDVLGYNGGGGVYGFCPFDLSQGKLVLDANLPSTLWALTIYSARGNHVYSVNSRQAGVDSFQLSVKQPPDLVTQITTDTETGALNDGWQVETAERKGLIVVWAMVDGEFKRAAIEKEMARTRCSIAAK
jgi:uncharacterized membrane protein